MTSNNTTRVPVVDKNGKQTTVHKNLNKGYTSQFRVAAVAQPNANPPYQRAVRTAIGEIYKDRNATVKKRNVDSDWKDVQALLREGTPYFGKLSDAIYEKVGGSWGNDPAKRREVAEKIVDLVGREDGIYSDFAVENNAEFAAVDDKTDAVIDGAVSKVINEPRTNERNNPFYTSQVLNRETHDLKADGDPKTFGAYYEFEYMGASEYEWGAIPKSLKNLHSADEIQIAEHEVEYNGVKRTAYFIGENVGPAVEAMDYAAKNAQENYGQLFRNKIGSGLEDAFTGGGYKSSPNRTVWLALDEDAPIIYTLDADRARDAAKILRRGSDEGQKFTKVEVNLT
jgi:hypothetical protein